jgi:hypothetical protein
LRRPSRTRARLLAKAEREVSRLGERYKTLDGAKADAVLDLLVAAREEKVAREGTVRQTEDALARVPVAPPTDEVLDLHSELARIVRGGDASDLNDRLRLVFDRFEIETLPDGRVLVLPFLREDLVDRYAAPDGYLRVLTSQGEQDPYSLIKMPPSAGPLIVLDELVLRAVLALPRARDGLHRPVAAVAHGESVQSERAARLRRPPAAAVGGLLRQPLLHAVEQLSADEGLDVRRLGHVLAALVVWGGRVQRGVAGGYLRMRPSWPRYSVLAQAGVFDAHSGVRAKLTRRTESGERDR